MNISIDFGEILTKAWKIVWKFKVLWIFGILAGCGAGNRGNFNNSFGNNGSSGNGYGNNGDLPKPFQQFQNMQPGEIVQSLISQYGQYLAIIAGVIVLICLLSLVFYFLGVMGKTGLIKGASKADAGAETLTFGELWTESLPYFWRMVGLSLLVGLPFFIIIIVLVVVFLAAIFGLAGHGDTPDGARTAGILAAVGVFVSSICCFAIAGIIVDMIVEQAKNAIVIENKGVIEGLRQGWDIFKRSFLTIILMAIILGVIGAIVGFIVVIPFVLIMIPTLAGILLVHTNVGVAMIPLLIGLGCCVVYVPVMIILGGIQQSYMQSVWTLTYLRLTASAPAEPPAPPVSPDPFPAVETVDAQ